jgi:hypothetical protein
MAHRTWLRLVMAIVLLAGESLAAISLVTASHAPARAQFFGDGFPFQNNGFPIQNRRQREPLGWFEPGFDFIGGQRRSSGRNQNDPHLRSMIPGRPHPRK